MAGVKKIFSLQLQASTLVEVTTALVIISMIFSMAVMIYLNVQSAGFTNARLLNNVMLDEAYSRALKSKDVEKNEELQYDGRTLIRSSKRHPQNGKLIILGFEIRNSEGRLLAERKYVLYVPV